MKALVLGVGNPIKSDDGVGVRVARLLKERNIPGVDVEELPASGLELLDCVLGYDLVVVIDAIRTKGGRPGDFYELGEDDFERTVHGASPHGVNIATALALGRRLVPERMPKKVVFVAVEASDLVNVSERLTPDVEAQVPRIVDFVEEKVRALLSKG